MAADTDLKPGNIKPSQTVNSAGVNLKPSLVLPAYSGGNPSSGDLKPSLVSGSNLKPALVTDADTLKTSMAGISDGGFSAAYTTLLGDADLVGHWRLDDNAASTTITATAGSNGALAGGNNTADITSTDVPIAALDSSLNLDGTADYIDLGDVLDGTAWGDGLKWSFAGWIKLGATSETAMLLSKFLSSGNGRQFFLRFIAGNVVEFLWYQSAGTGAAYRADKGTTALSSTSAWYHVAVTHDGALTYTDRTTIYINGSEDGTTTSITSGTPDYIGNRTSDLEIGSFNGGSNYLNARISEHMVYSRILTAGEVSTLATG